MSGYLDGSPDLADFVRTLSRHGVAYMVVGGHAVGFHSKPRATKDLDVWIDKSPENRKRIAVALAAYGARRQIAEHVLTAAEDEIVWFGRPPNRVDIILTLPGVEFAEARARACSVPSGGEEIPIHRAAGPHPEQGMRRP
jgi:hypothetical protein